jgi:hypothetical protein
VWQRPVAAARWLHLDRTGDCSPDYAHHHRRERLGGGLRQARRRGLQGRCSGGGGCRYLVSDAAVGRTTVVAAPPRELAELQQAVRARFPDLMLVLDGYRPRFRGSFPIVHDGRVLDRILIEIAFPGGITRPPAIWEIGGRIPRTLDRHLFIVGLLTEVTALQPERRLLRATPLLVGLMRSARPPRAHPSSRVARIRSFDVTPFTARPVTFANGDWAGFSTGVTAYTRPSWRRIWTSPSRDASSSTSARRCRAVE